MQENYLYEYAVIRLVPRVEREEFINIGIILYCPAQKFLQTKFVLNTERLKALSCQEEMPEIEKYLNAWVQICVGGKAGGTIGSLPIASRFRWLTATRSTIIQASKVHIGKTENPALTLDRLLDELVL